MQNFHHTINLKALSSITLFANVICLVHKGYQWWALAVLELTSEYPDSYFDFDSEDCNICLKSKYFNENTIHL